MEVPMSQVTFFSAYGKLFATAADCDAYKEAAKAYNQAIHTLDEAIFAKNEAYAALTAAADKSCGTGNLPYAVLDPGCAGYPPIKATETQTEIIKTFLDSRVTTCFVHGGARSGKTLLTQYLIAQLLNTTRPGNPACIGFLGYNAMVVKMFVEKLRESLKGEFRTSSLGLVTMANGNQLRVIDKADAESIRCYSWDYAFMDTQPKDMEILKEMQSRVCSKNGKVFIAFDSTKLSKEVTDFIEDRRKNSEVIFTIQRSDFDSQS
jgi:hypothetical protein